MGGCLTKVPGIIEPTESALESLPEKVGNSIISAFKKGAHIGTDLIHELECTLDRGIHVETCIPGIYTYNGFHDVVEEVLNIHVGHEIGILKGTAALSKVIKKLNGEKRTPENWAKIQQGVCDSIGSAVQFPKNLDSTQLITLMKFNPFFTMGMHYDQESDQYCFDATKNSPNRLVSLVFEAFEDDYACSKLYFSRDLTEVVLEVDGKSYTESMGDVFHKKLRVFITCMLYWFQVCHATLHVYIYVMLGCANKAVYTTKLQDFVKQYEPNILLKYLEVKFALFGGQDVLKGGKDSWKVTDPAAVDIAALEIFKTMASARNSRDWLRHVFLAGCSEMINEPEIQQQAKQYAAMLPHLSDATMDALRKQYDSNADFVEEIAETSDVLVDYLRHTDGGEDAMQNYFGINTFQDWIECQGMAGILHGNTLGLTRLQYTDYCEFAGNWNTNVISHYTGGATVAVGTLIGLEEQHAINETVELEETPFEEMMQYFHTQTKDMQVEFWDSLSAEDKDTYAWCKSVWGPNMVDQTQLTITSYI